MIKTLTSDGSDATMSFVDGSDDVTLDSTYPIYRFSFINIHPETDRVRLMFQANASGGSGYNETITSTHFVAYHDAADSGTNLAFEATLAQGQGTAFQILTDSFGNDNDQSVSGYLDLFNPSSTTYVKHFISSFNMSYWQDYTFNSFVAGYFNTTSAIDEIQFKMSADEIQGGKIKLYGLKDSA